MERTLIEELKRTKNSNTLFVSHYFFALIVGVDLIFYYNPNQFWYKCKISEIDVSVIENLKKECAVFKNFDPDKKYNLGQFENWTSYKPFLPETPKIGNHYSCLGNRILSHHRNFYYFGSFGGCVKQSVKKLIEKDIQELLYYAVITNTPKYIKSIYNLKSLKCSKK